MLGCIATLKAGKVSADAEPELHDIAPGLLRVDAHGGFSQCAFRLGLPHLLEKARSQGIAAMAVNRCVHFSALWVEVEALTEAGLVALATTPSHAWVRRRRTQADLRHQPDRLWLAASGRPAVRLRLRHQRRGAWRDPVARTRRQANPAGLGVDEQGEPTTDASAALRGAMLTFGGHKGSALAAMVELLAGPLIGDLTSAESLAYDEGSRSSPYGGELLIAIDPRRMLGASAEEHLARAETLFEGIVEQGARLPSQRRFEARERSARDGVTIPEALHRELLALLE